MAEAVLKNSALIDDLFEGILGKDPVIRSRASHAVRQVARARPELVQPCKDLLIQEVSGIRQWEVRHYFCQILPLLELTPDDIAQANRFFRSYLDDRSSIVRTCAMQALADLTELEPALLPEVLPLIEALTQSGTAAMRARGRMLLKRLNR